MVKDEITDWGGNKRLLLVVEEKPGVRRWNAQPGQTMKQVALPLEGSRDLEDNADAGEATDAGRR